MPVAYEPTVFADDAETSQKEEKKDTLEGESEDDLGVGILFEEEGDDDVGVGSLFDLPIG